MYTIYMELGNDWFVKMETVDSLKEAVRRCELYHKRNPHMYWIEVAGTKFWYTDFLDVLED